MSKNVIKDEQGMTMIVVLGIMLILTALSFGLIAISENDLLLTTRDTESMEALHIAEAGIQKALWQLEEQGNVMQPRSFTISVGGGTATVNAVQGTGAQQWYWDIESIGAYGVAARKLKVTVFNFLMWNMNIGNGSLASGGNGMVGNTSIDGPFYVRGNVGLSGSSDITGGPLFIKTGTLSLSGGSRLGEPDMLIDAYIEPAGGHEDIVDGQGDPLEKGDQNVYVDRLLNTVPNIILPSLDSMLDYRMVAASESSENPDEVYPGIVDTQTASSGYKVLDNDLNISTGDLGSRNTYKIDDTVDSFGLGGNNEFAWDNEENKLYVNGTIFVDGNLTIGDNTHGEINYYGRGTFVVNGDIYINGQLRPPLGEVNGMNDSHVLGLVTAETIYIDVNSGNTQPNRDVPDVSGAFFAVKRIALESNNTSFVGSMISSVLDIADMATNSHLFTHDGLPDFLPPSLPGNDGFLTMTTSWREVN